ncbi:unnamed protein product, partial [Iphiclides podalirius]
MKIVMSNSMKHLFKVRQNVFHSRAQSARVTSADDQQMAGKATKTTAAEKVLSSMNSAPSSVRRIILKRYRKPEEAEINLSRRRMAKVGACAQLRTPTASFSTSAYMWEVKGDPCGGKLGGSTAARRPAKDEKKGPMQSTPPKSSEAGAKGEIIAGAKVTRAFLF